MTDFYKMLGVSYKATSEEIETAYNHFKDIIPEDWPTGIKIKEAYETLINPTMRQGYDLALRDMFKEQIHQNVLEAKRASDETERDPQFQRMRNVLQEVANDPYDFNADTERRTKGRTEQPLKDNNLFIFMNHFFTYAIVSVLINLLLNYLRSQGTLIDPVKIMRFIACIALCVGHYGVLKFGFIRSIAIMIVSCFWLFR